MVSGLIEPKLLTYNLHLTSVAAPEKCNTFVCILCKLGWAERGWRAELFEQILQTLANHI